GHGSGTGLHSCGGWNRGCTACWQRGTIFSRRRVGRHCRPWEEKRFVPVVHLPFVPEQDHGKAKYHPQDGAPDVVHGDFFGEDVEEAGAINRENNRVARGASCGTGSWPPSHQGWQRANRPSVNQAPAAAPCCCRACSEYAE